MPKPRALFLFIGAAVLCFVVALLLTLGVFHGTNEHAWEVGGFLSVALALAVSFLP